MRLQISGAPGKNPLTPVQSHRIFTSALGTARVTDG